MKTVKITVCNEGQIKRALHAQANTEHIAYALNGVVIEIEEGDLFEFDAGEGCEYDTNYIALMKFVRGDN